MTLKVRNKTYDVELNGTDYVCQTEPQAEDFDGVFNIEVDGEEQKNMMLANIFNGEDGWHICLYEQPESERQKQATENDITDLQAAVVEIYEMLL